MWAMYFEIEHVFEASVEALASAMVHPAYPAFFLARSPALNGLATELREESEDLIRRRLHYAPRPVFDRLGPKVIAPQWFEFVQESVFDKRTNRLTFSNIPCTERAARKFQSQGEIVLESLSPERSRRRVRTELELRGLPLALRPLSYPLQQRLAREARHLLECEARALAEWLAS